MHEIQNPRTTGPCQNSSPSLSQNVLEGLLRFLSMYCAEAVVEALGQKKVLAGLLTLIGLPVLAISARSLRLPSIVTQSLEPGRLRKDLLRQ